MVCRHPFVSQGGIVILSGYLSATVRPVQIIDDGGTGYSNPSGDWYSSSGSGYQNDYSSAYGGGTADWTFTVSPGSYQVAATWPADWWASSSASYTVKDGTTTVATVAADQQSTPDDFSEGAWGWRRSPR